MTGESTKRLARRLNARQFATYAETPPSRPEWTAARVVLVAVSVVLLALVVAAFVAGLTLVLRDFPSLWIVPGALLLALGWTLRPRVGRSSGDEWATVSRQDAPTLFALIDRVAAASGAPVPDHVALDFEFNAAAGIHGLLRRRRLCLGLPLWGVLSPQQRVALLAHEFGHFVNGDPAQRLLTQPALTTPGAIAELLKPSESLTGGSGPLLALLEALLRPVQRLFAWLFTMAQVGLLAVASRDHQRAEYCADAVAVRLAGTDATIALMEVLVASAQLNQAVDAAERGIRATPGREHPGVVVWRERAEAARVRLDLVALREKSVAQDASLWASHPPAGLRAQIVESWPRQEPSLVLSVEDSDRIDAELAKWYSKAGRDLVWH